MSRTQSMTPQRCRRAGPTACCSSATCSPPSSAAASYAGSGEVDAVLRRIDDVPWWSRPLARHLFARERAGAGDRRPARRRARAAVRRPPGAGARLHRRRRAASREARRATSPISAPPRPRCAAASRRHLPQRSRQGAELAARRRRARLCDRLPARRPLLAGAASCSGIAAYEDLRHLLKHKRTLRAGGADADRAARSSRARAGRRRSGWRPASGSTSGSRAACSTSPTAKAAARGWSTTRPRSRRAQEAPRACAMPRWSLSPTAAPASGSTPLSRPTRSRGKRSCATSSPPPRRAKPPEQLQVVAGAATRCRRRGAHRNPAARRDEPDRPDRRR